MKFRILLTFLFGFTYTIQAQNITSEKVEFRIPLLAKNPIDVANRTFKVKVTSPYTLKTDDIIAQSKVDFQTELKNYEKVVAASEVEYQKKVANYEQDAIKSKEKYKLESDEYKKMTMLERLAVNDQGKEPKLTMPTKPQYIKPSPPVYGQPDLNNYIIVDNEVLASQIAITGFSRDGNYIDVSVDVKRMNFQDTAGQTFANQPKKR